MPEHEWKFWDDGTLHWNCPNNPNIRKEYKFKHHWLFCPECGESLCTHEHTETNRFCGKVYVHCVDCEMILK